MSIINFEKLAEMAVRREIKSSWPERGNFDLKMSIFKTEVEDKSLGRTVTVWFEIQCFDPIFWDLMPVTIIYRDKELTLGDICERTKRFFDVAITRLYRKHYRRFAGDLSDF